MCKCVKTSTFPSTIRGKVYFVDEHRKTEDKTRAAQLKLQRRKHETRSRCIMVEYYLRLLSYDHFHPLLGSSVGRGILKLFLFCCVILSLALIHRHAGVLGLASCVQAFPYDVPSWMPQILLDLGDHLHDPHPIQVGLEMENLITVFGAG